jgi:pimeloyl-ACP methyl ester carboxylesterase
MQMMPVVLRTEDGVRLDGFHLRAATDATDLAIVLAHGFSGTWRGTAQMRIAALLAGDAGVVGFDFRGHGRSDGHSTVGDREILDVQAAVAKARALGYRRVATLGFSMGAAVVLRHAGLIGGVAAVAAVSGPGRWYYRGTPSMRQLHWVVEQPLGRLFSRLALGTRIGSQRWGDVERLPADLIRPEPAPDARSDPPDAQPEPPSGGRIEPPVGQEAGAAPAAPSDAPPGDVPVPPAAAAARISPTPLLVVHGDQDRFFPVSHAHMIYDAAAEPKELWIETGYGHAESAASPELITRIAGWIRRSVTDRDDG